MALAKLGSSNMLQGCGHLTPMHEEAADKEDFEERLENDDRWFNLNRDRIVYKLI